ncbi:MAG: hypothetical protein H7223_05145 [Pedobacter sp.]|nr:hypothetical protein [Pedobacter sp.]
MLSCFARVCFGNLLRPYLHAFGYTWFNYQLARRFA